MMQIGFVDHHHAGMIQRGLVTKVVINVVADLVQRHVKIGWLEMSGLGGEHLYVHQRLQFVEQSGGIIGNSAARRRQAERKRRP